MKSQSSDWKGLIVAFDAEGAENRIGDVDADLWMDEGDCVAVGVEDEDEAELSGYAIDDLIEALCDRGLQLRLGLSKEALSLLAEGDALLHEALQLSLSLEHNALWEVLLPVKELCELALELILGSSSFGIVLSLECGKIITRFFVLRHLLVDLVVAEVSELRNAHG